ncbi:hypothetical protein N7534_012138 [Penicillium rubens]|nr:hypothetical protein N7534_012138 [Penicillium rubens]
MRPGTNWPVCPPEPTAAPPIPSPAPSTPYPHAGALSNGPRGAGLLCTPPTKAPGKVAPFDPRPPSRSANWRICKIAISSAPSRVFTDPPPKPRLPKPREGAPAPCVHPAPRASRSAARFARRLRLHLTPSTSPAGARQLPPPRQLAPHAPPSQGREAPPAAPRPGAGGGGPPVAHGYVGTGVPGVVPRGSPCQGPHRNIPRHPGTPHATRRGHSCGPSLPQPRTVGPGSLLHRLTDPIWGVKMQNAVQVAGNCSGGQFLYGGGPCTAKSPYKVGHFFEKLSDILGT